MVNPKNKGAAGERELMDLFKVWFGSSGERVFGQASSNNPNPCDIKMPPFAIEVKRRESLDLWNWWTQIWRAAITLNELEPLETLGHFYHGNNQVLGWIPVVAYRQNRISQWSFLVPANELVPGSKSYAQVTEKTFKEWVKK